MILKFLGAAQTVTGSKILIQNANLTGLIDCGLFQGSKELRLKNWQKESDLNYDKVNFILLTHAHIDHCGYLPKMYRNGFRGIIYCSSPTADLLEIMLLDAAKLQLEDAGYANKTHHSKHLPALPLFDENDVLNILKLVVKVDWKKEINLHHNLSFILNSSGHILGSATILLKYLEGKNTKKILFSGDLGSQHSIILKNRENRLDADFVVVESTYGHKSIQRESSSTQLQDCINKVFQQQGTLVIPAFSLGRAQDIIYLIAELKKKDLIPLMNVYLDSPMSNKITQVYQKHFHELKEEIQKKMCGQVFLENDFRSVVSVEDSIALVNDKTPKIVISASGMVQGGRVIHYLKALLPDAKNGVLFVGFQALGTKGRLLKNGISRIRLHHEDVYVRAEIFSLDGFSAHADSDELIGWLSDCATSPQKTFINHGEIEGSLALAYRIKNELHWSEVFIPHDQESFNLSI